MRTSVPRLPGSWIPSRANTRRGRECDAVRTVNACDKPREVRTASSATADAVGGAQARGFLQHALGGAQDAPGDDAAGGLGVVREDQRLGLHARGGGRGGRAADLLEEARAGDDDGARPFAVRDP